MSQPLALTYDGYCPICEAAVRFSAQYDWYRDHLLCEKCNSVPRERALAMVLAETRPAWRQLRIHECSPGGRGVSLKMHHQCSKYTPTHYFPEAQPGEIVRGYRNENLGAQTFGDSIFDIVVSEDVMEHVNEPADCIREVYRTLAPGGVYIFTAPTLKDLTATARKARYSSDGTVEFVGEPEYHKNPIDERGSPVTFHYGYDFPDLIRSWAPFDTRVVRFNDRRHGVIGEFTEVYVCAKAES
ncbi:MAG: methyltransferase domain-containing protein [Terricaulis sp.]